MIRPDVHLCLLSEQPTPNICPLLDSRLQPDEVMLVVTPQQERRVDDYRDVLHSRGTRVTSLPVTDAFDAGLVEAVLEGEVTRRLAGGQKVFINATGGTKPMSIAAYMVGFGHDVPVFYVHDDTLVWLHNPGGFAPVELQERLRLDAFLRAHGVELQAAAPAQIRPELKELGRYLVAHADMVPAVGRLNRIAAECGDSRRLTYEMDARDVEDQAFQALLDRFAEAKVVSVKGRNLSFRDDLERRWCNGLWLEDYVAPIVQRLKGEPGLEIQDVTRSADVRFVGQGAQQGRLDRTDTELDCAFLAGNLLYVIECKTRRIRADGDFDPSDALYKLATLKREIGGSQARAMLASYYPLRDVDRRRAAILGIEVCAGRELPDLEGRIRNWVAGARARNT